jgi:hypothetical protein
MRPETGLRVLRDEIEAVTILPSFADLFRRARKVRRRDRLAVVGALVGTLAVFLPVALASMFGRPAYTPSPISPPDDNVVVAPALTVTPTASGDRSEVTVRAAAGLMPDDVYAAVDVCVPRTPNRHCSLQVITLRVKDTWTRVLSTGALRDGVTDRLDDVRLAPIAANTVMVSGTVAGVRKNLVVAAASASLIPVPPTTAVDLGSGARAVQLADEGDVYGVRQDDGVFGVIPQQPTMRKATVATAIPPGMGWWVTGVARMSGAPVVAVSRDQGQTWTERALDTSASGQIGTPVIATYDGVTVHAFVRYKSGLRHFVTRDGGGTWTEPASRIMLPGRLAADGALDGRLFGAAARPDRSVLVWIQDQNLPTFLNSDDGITFAAYTGPIGMVQTVQGGFVSLGSHPQLSYDCTSWINAIMPDPVRPS